MKQCALCYRPGQLVTQAVQPPNALGIGPWVFRYYLCPWHRGAENRRRCEGQKKTVVIEYVDDETLLKGGGE